MVSCADVKSRRGLGSIPRLDDVNLILRVPPHGGGLPRARVLT